MKMEARKRTEQINSAEIVASIDDLLVEILVRLPLKSLARFKSLSKHWNSLFTNPKLVNRINPNHPIGLISWCDYYESISWIEYFSFIVEKPTIPKKLNFAKDQGEFKIVQSCNGLLLCAENRGRSNCSYRLNCSYDYYVCNPTTGKFVHLPEIDGIGKIWVRIRGMCLAFDPEKSVNYQVVSVVLLKFNGGKCMHQIYIYSSETGLWRVGSEPVIECISCKEAVYWNGAVHDSPWPKPTMYFNVESQTFGKLPVLPSTRGWAWGSGRKLYFGESRDHLHYIETFKSEICFKLYEMKRDYSEWFLKYEVDLSSVLTAYPEVIPSDGEPGLRAYSALNVLSFIRGEKEDDSFLILDVNGKAVRYNLVSKSPEKLHEFEHGYFHRGFQYFESLCCV